MPCSVGGLRPRPRTGDHQIARELHVKRRQRRIGPGGGSAARRSSVGICGGARAEADAQPPEQPLMLANMHGEQCIEILLRRLGQPRDDGSDGIAADIVKATEARRRIDQDHHLIGARHLDARVASLQAIASDDHLCPNGKIELAVDPLGAAIVATPLQRVAIDQFEPAGLLRGQADRDVDGAGPIGAQPHHDHIVDRGCEHLPRELHSPGRKPRRRDRGVEVERPPVRSGRAEPVRVDPEVAGRLIRHLFHRTAPSGASPPAPRPRRSARRRSGRAPAADAAAPPD